MPEGHPFQAYDHGGHTVASMVVALHHEASSLLLLTHESGFRILLDVMHIMHAHTRMHARTHARTHTHTHTHLVHDWQTSL